MAAALDQLREARRSPDGGNRVASLAGSLGIGRRSQLANQPAVTYLQTMQAAVQTESLSVAVYLAAEEASEVKHEYIGGLLYAIAGTTKDHNLIAGNIYAALRPGLRSGTCRTFFADLKVRLRIKGEDIFYYPDVVVGCDRRDTHKNYLRFPKVIFEVLSDSTVRLDRREKKGSYQTIETLEEYVIVAEELVEVTVFRRANDWQPEILNRLEQTLELRSLNLSIPLSAIYETVK